MNLKSWLRIRKSGNDLWKVGGIMAMIAVISAFHFGTSTEFRYLHEIYQRTYYLPILLAAFWYGPIPGVASAFLVSAIYVVHIRLDWHHAPVYTFNQYAEILLYHGVALVIGILSSREKRQRARLEAASAELSEAYRRLQDTFEQLRRADRLAALGALSAGIAHEVRNPLGAIKGSIEILESEIPPGHPKREFIDIIKEEIARLNRTVTEVLQFARPPQPAVEPSSIPGLIESTLTLILKEADASGVEVRLEFDRTMPVIRVDPNQIRQVLLNILLNALQAMPGGGRISIAAGHNRTRDEAWIEVTDSGPGIQAEAMERIFDPFYSTKPGGTGLGLSISHQLIRNHSGSITALPGPSGGLLIRITLPYRTPTPTAEAFTSSSA